MSGSGERFPIVVIEQDDGAPHAFCWPARMHVAGIELSNPEKVLYPKPGITKREVAAHYERVAEHMLPLVAHRPLTLVRCPDGVDGECFFHKHAGDDIESGLDAIEVPEKRGKARYRGLHDLTGLIALVQLGALEIHLHGARADDLERPDRVVFDLDPGPGLGFADVVEAARRVRHILDDRDLRSFVMTTGGKGLHVVVPVERRHSFDDARAFAHDIATRLAEEDPGRYVARAAKDERRGRLFVDYLRNSAGATAIAPYSTRAKPDATVATPLRWDELGHVDSAGAYRIDNLGRRLAQLDDDPWRGYSDLHQRLPSLDG